MPGFSPDAIERIRRMVKRVERAAPARSKMRAQRPVIRANNSLVHAYVSTTTASDDLNAVTDTSPELIEFDSVTGTAGFWDAGEPTKITFASGGLYHIDMIVDFDIQFDVGETPADSNDLVRLWFAQAHAELLFNGETAPTIELTDAISGYRVEISEAAGFVDPVYFTTLDTSRVRRSLVVVVEDDDYLEIGVWAAPNDTSAVYATGAHVWLHKLG